MLKFLRTERDPKDIFWLKMGITVLEHDPIRPTLMCKATLDINL